MEELQKAKISRGVLANNTEKQISQLNICLKEQQAKPDVLKNNLRSLEMLIQKTKDTLTKYEESVIRCLHLGKVDEDLWEADEHIIRKGKCEDTLAVIEFDAVGFIAQVEEKLSIAYVQANPGVQVAQHAPGGNTGRAPAKAPPPMPKQMDMEEFTVWRETWNDYVRVSKLGNEQPLTQISTLKSHMSQGMRALIKHALGIDEDTTKSCNEILDDIRDHLRKSRNITIDRIAFERRVQKNGETFDDYLVEVRKLARLANLCQHCLDARLLTKLMCGLQDVETKHTALLQEAQQVRQDSQKTQS